MPPDLRFEIRVKPGARRAAVGGTWGEDAALVVAVQQPARGGAANDAVVRALADALGVPRRRLRIVTGQRARTKLVELHDPPQGSAETLRRLRDRPHDEPRS